MAHTKQSLADWIRAADVQDPAHVAALSRALLHLYARQTYDERASGETSQRNGQGFTAFDASFLTSVAQGIQRYGRMTAKQAAAVQRKLPKYAGQLLTATRQGVDQGQDAGQEVTTGQGAA